jgi:GntR family transcriptional regulator, transcriptional repressor for pyruvate dehydrogenase complex
MEREIIKRSLLSDAVIEAIHKQILNGKLKPGDRLPSEKEMCKLFSVGRSTLREAIKALTVVNVLDKKKNGTFVSKKPDLTFKMDANCRLFLKQESYRELLEVRKILEVKISGLSAMRATAQDLSLMESIVQSMARNLENNCYREYIQDDLNFHQAIAASTNNQFLLNQIITIREMLTDLYEKLVTSSVFPRCHEHHCLILEAICRRDVAAVEELMIAHLEEVEVTINEQIKRYLEEKA